MPDRLRLSRAPGSRLSAGAKSVARPTMWGNPFKIGSTGWVPVDSSGRWSKEPHPPLTREQAVECFRLSMTFAVREDPGYLDDLRGHDLGCWCPLPDPGEPDICHAAVLLELANGGAS